MRRSKSAITEEVRLSALEVPLLTIRRRPVTLTENSPPWVLRTEPPALIGPLTTEETITWKNLNTKRKRFAAASNLEQEAESLAVPTRPTAHELVKKDRFGPEVEEVTLQMPPLFPKFAGDLCRHTHIHTYIHTYILHTYIAKTEI
jgi:hypothetical protein